MIALDAVQQGLPELRRLPSCCAAISEFEFVLVTLFGTMYAVYRSLEGW
jgi:hypothetical protein